MIESKTDNRFQIDVFKTQLSFVISNITSNFQVSEKLINIRVLGSSLPFFVISQNLESSCYADFFYN